MYQKMKAYRRSKGNTPLVLAGLCCLVIVTAVIGLIVWAGLFRLRYWDFVEDLSNSTVYACDQDCLRADIEGQAVRVTGDHAYMVYNLISGAGPGRVQKQLPDEEPAAVLDYGDGSRMRLWSVKLVNPSNDREYGLFLEYVNREGKRYAFDTDQLSLDSVTRYLTLPQNGPWEAP